MRGVGPQGMPRALSRVVAPPACACVAAVDNESLIVREPGQMANVCGGWRKFGHRTADQTLDEEAIRDRVRQPLARRRDDAERIAIADWPILMSGGNVLQPYRILSF